MTNEHTEAVKHVVDGVSVITVVGTVAEVLPAIAALFTIVWTAVRIYETNTVQKWIYGDNPEEDN